MPRLSDSMEEGTIVRWLVSDGDAVSRGDEIAEIETDKATMTYEADSAGVIALVAQEGDTLPIGSVIARLNGGPPAAEAPAAEAPPAPREEPAPAQGAPASREEPAQAQGAPASREEPASREAPAAAAAQAEPAPAAAQAEPAPAAAPEEPVRSPSPAGDGGTRVKASPIARRLASEQGVDLSALRGSGPGGRIVRADVEAAAGGAPAEAPAPAAPSEPAAPSAPEAPPAPAPPAEAPSPATARGEVTVVELSRTQQTIARRMAESRATVPDFTLHADVDMDQAWRARESLKAAAREGEPVPSLNDLVVKACALALREFPRVNAAYRDGRFELYPRVNVGVAVAVPDALVVPTIFDADRRTLGEIAAVSRELSRKVRDGSITPPELSGATFTVSNLGMHGIREFVAVINPPQAAILSVGAVEERPVVRDGEIVPGRRMSLALACDHRILYGADAAEFLARVRTLLEAPLSLAV